MHLAAAFYSYFCIHNYFNTSMPKFTCLVYKRLLIKNGTFAAYIVLDCGKNLYIKKIKEDK